MQMSTPHFLLLSESGGQRNQGRWRFVLQSIDGSDQFEAADDEPEIQGERLELLAVVRGLEALSQPSRVTLVTPSKYVNRGLSDGLEEWRANDWQWEHFGEMVPVKNRDLWQRVDRAMRYHKVDCRTWRFDLPHTAPTDEQPPRPAHQPVGPAVRPDRRRRTPLSKRLKRAMAIRRARARRHGGLRLWLAQLGTRLLPMPWLE